MFGLKNYLTLKQFKVDQQSYETITRLCCKGLWLICLDYQLSTEVIWNPCMHPLSSLPLPISAANCFQRPREEEQDPPPFCIEFPPRGREGGLSLPSSLSLSTPPDHATISAENLSGSSLALPSFSPLPVGLQYNLHGRRGMPLFSESNSCSIEPTRIALHIFCLRRAEMEGGSAK